MDKLKRRLVFVIPAIAVSVSVLIMLLSVAPNRMKDEVTEDIPVAPSDVGDAYFVKRSLTLDEEKELSAKIGWKIERAIEQYTGERPFKLLGPTSPVEHEMDPDHPIKVLIILDSTQDENLAKLEDMGVETVTKYTIISAVKAFVPADKVLDVAKLEFVRTIDDPDVGIEFN